MRFTFDVTAALIPTGDLILLVDGVKVDCMKLETSIRFDAFETFDVGMNQGAPVSCSTGIAFPFPLRRRSSACM